MAAISLTAGYRALLLFRLAKTISSRGSSVAGDGTIKATRHDVPRRGARA
jgi:hypothetical protein